MRRRAKYTRNSAKITDGDRPLNVLPFFLGGAIGVTASGCSSLQTPRTKTQTSAIYAFGLPAIVITHDATQTADYSGGDTNETMQSNK